MSYLCSRENPIHVPFFLLKTFPNSRKDLSAKKLILKEWWHCLEGLHHSFLVLTDHQNLKHIHEAHGLNPHQACWRLFFTRFNFIILCPGAKNIKADVCLISIPSETQDEPILPPKIIFSLIQWFLDDRLTQANATEPAQLGRPTYKTYVLLCNDLYTFASVHPLSGHWPPRNQ